MCRNLYLIYLFTSFIFLFIYSFIYLFICLFIHLFIMQIAFLQRLAFFLNETVINIIIFYLIILVISVVMSTNTMMCVLYVNQNSYIYLHVLCCKNNSSSFGTRRFREFFKKIYKLFQDIS